MSLSEISAIMSFYGGAMKEGSEGGGGFTRLREVVGVRKEGRKEGRLLWN